MATPQSVFNYTMQSAGDTVALDVSELYVIYNLIPETIPVVLLGNLVIEPSGTPKEGMKFVFNYGGLVAYDGGVVEIFGRVLSAVEAIRLFTITCTYINSIWVVKLEFSDLSSINGNYLADSTVTNSKLAGSIALSKILASTRGFLIRAGISGIWESFNAVISGNIVLGNGTDVVSVPMSGDATINGAGVITLTNNVVNTAKITDGNITVAKLETSLKTDSKFISASFETNELGAYKIKMPFAGSIINVYVEVVKPLAITDDGTVILKNNAGTTMTLTTPIVIPASTVFGTAYDTSVTANNTFIGGDILTINTAKTTAGGKILVTLTVLRS